LANPNNIYKENNSTIKKELINILKKIKLYKKKNKAEKEELQLKLLTLQSLFNHYKIEKQKELKELKSKLHSTNRALKKVKTVKPKIKIIEKTKIVKEIVYKEIEVPVELSTPKEESELMEVIVPNGMDIYQLALLYYGDAKKYRELYNINRDIIGSDLKVKGGQSVKVPIDLLFKSEF